MRFSLITPLLAISLAASAAATPYTPANDTEIIETLPKGLIFASQFEGPRDDAQDLSPANTPDVATKQARELIRIARREGDPRLMSYAEATLAPYFLQGRAVADHFVLRAIIRQFFHDFPAALLDLDQALLLDPKHAQALLTKSSVLTVVGRAAEAKRNCGGLLQIADQLTIAACVASASGVLGEGKKSYVTLSRVVDASRGAPADLLAWAQGLLADLSERFGQDAQAESHFQEALRLTPTDSFLLAAYSDFLLRTESPQKVLPLLSGKEQFDALLLRLAIAEKRLGNTEHFSKLQAILSERIKASRERGDTVHLREEALAELDVFDHPAQAFTLANQNWDNQREPFDLLLLARAARANKRLSAIETTLAWRAVTKLEDSRLDRVLSEAGAQ